MFKLLTIVVGLYLLYRLYMKSSNLGPGEPQPPLDDPGEEEYVDYEEVE